jgi:hypothetical protein
MLGDTLSAMLDIAEAVQPDALDTCHLNIEHPCADTFRTLHIQGAHLTFVRHVHTLCGNDRRGLSVAKKRFFEEARPAFSRTMISLAKNVSEHEPLSPLTFRPHHAFTPPSLALLMDEGIVEQSAVEALSLSLTHYLSASLSLMNATEAEIRPMQLATQTSARMIGLIMATAAAACFTYGQVLPDAISAPLGENIALALQYGLDMLVPQRLVMSAILPITHLLVQRAKARSLLIERLGSSSQRDVEYWQQHMPMMVEQYSSLTDSATLDVADAPGNVKKLPPGTIDHTEK